MKMNTWISCHSIILFGWSREKIYFPFEAGDNSVIIENQRNARISFRELTQEYKDGILEIISQIAPEIRISDVKKMLKNI